MDRRTYLSGLVSGGVLLAGCSETAPGTGDRTVSGNRTTAKTTSVSQGEYEIRVARESLSKAFEHFDRYRLVEDGRSQLTRDHISGYEKRPATDPAAVVRNELKPAVRNASGQRKTRIEALLAVANYTEQKAYEYLYLISGQMSIFRFKVAWGHEKIDHDEAIDHAETAQSHLKRANEYQQKANSYLSMVAESTTTPSVEGFDVEAEESEQEVLAAQIPVLFVTANGFEEYTRGAKSSLEASEVVKRDEYSLAREKYGEAADAMEAADESFQLAKEHDAQYHRRLMMVFVCFAGDFAVGFGHLRDGADARVEGDMKLAKEHSQKGLKALESAQNRCVPENFDETTTTEQQNGGGGEGSESLGVTVPASNLA